MFANCLRPETLVALKKLSGTRSLAVHDFYLAGGTGLTLHLGHRLSEDLDFFTKQSFDPDQLVRLLAEEIKIAVLQTAEHTLYAFCDDTVKVSFFFYPYQLMYPSMQFQGCSVADFRDIGAMKMIALAQRSMKKDFVDLFYLLRQKVSLDELRNIIMRKYFQVNYSWVHLVRSMGYFEDAETDPMPVMLIAGKEQELSEAEWNQIKKFFRTLQRQALEQIRNKPLGLD